MKHTFDEIVKDNRNKRKALKKMQKELEFLRKGVNKLANHQMDIWEEYMDGYADLKDDANMVKDIAENLRKK